MEKLLNERLREYYEAGGMGDLFVNGNNHSSIFADEARDLAREIERCYIPRPRFEDGEPVQFGDEVDCCDGGVNALLLFKDGSGQAYGTLDNAWDPDAGACFDCGEKLKRPAPKVLDADGVPTKNGDRVYPINKRVYSDADGYFVNHIEVDDGIESPRVYFIDDVGMSWMKASELTHEKPKFDADGERIKVGDTVYSLLKDGEEPFGTCYVVTAIDTSRELPVSCGHWGEREWLFKGTSLTHREPDSLEKLRDDINEWTDKNDHFRAHSGKVTDSWVDRLTALIERGA